MNYSRSFRVRSARAAAVLFAGSAVAQPVPPLATGPTLDVRVRYESVHDAVLPDDAQALTARVRVGYRWLFAPGWQLYGEAEHTEALQDDYNSTANGRTTYPIVADPQASDLNQAYVSYAQPTWSASVGRQRIALDNQRFIGNVGWRQNEQTFDAAGASRRFGEAGPTLRYYYLDKVHRVFGNQNPNPLLQEFDLDAHLVNVSQPLPIGTLVGYAYLIDNQDLAAGSSRTMGLRWSGTRPPGELMFGWAVEAARQADYAENPASFELDYWLIEPSLTWRGVQFKAGLERMEGNGRVGFSTPLATLHAFNGWAERFLVTPPDGIEHRYVSASGKLAQATWTAIHHQFDAERIERDYGRELDLQLSYPFTSRLSGLLKSADYDSEGFSSDETTFWAALEYKY